MKQKSNAHTTVVSRLIQVNPYCLSTAWEVWVDLAPHFEKGDHYHIEDPYSLLGVVTDYFEGLDSLDHYKHRDLADKIVWTFGLDKR